MSFCKQSALEQAWESAVLSKRIQTLFSAVILAASEAVEFLHFEEDG
jgi:hypothetical protein